LIARKLRQSAHTVERDMARIYDKTGQPSRSKLAAWYASHRAI
jgi:DNA-binding CsgD family transcriptional regulator